MPAPLGEKEQIAYVEHLAECQKCTKAALGPAKDARKGKCPIGLSLWQAWQRALGRSAE